MTVSFSPIFLSFIMVFCLFFFFDAVIAFLKPKFLYCVIPTKYTFKEHLLYWNPSSFIAKKIDEKDQPISELAIISHNFHHTSWNENESDWPKLLRKWNKKGASIRIIGGPKIDHGSKETLYGLVRDKVITVHVPKRPFKKHFLIVDNDTLWKEFYHTHKNAFLCSYTENPIPEILSKYKNKFETLWDKSKEITKNDISSLPSA